MASTPSFEWVSQELERITSLERLEARGTLRLVLKKAGLDASGVTARTVTGSTDSAWVSATLAGRLSLANTWPSPA